MNPLIIGATKKYAYVVTMFGGSGYIPGSITVAHAFRRFKDDQYVDIVCMVTEDVPIEARKVLSYYFTHVIVIDYLIFNGAVNATVLQNKPHYAKVWTKFQALRLTEYDKICLIDADYLPVQSMLSVFDYNSPAAVSEVPTGVSTESFDFTRDSTYAPEWEDLFGKCCQTGRVLPGIVLLMLMYSNNVDSESGRYAEMPSFTGNFYYGGMNASVMVLKPDIHEFKSIIDDLSTYDQTKRLTFFYPEQQYLTVRYAFGNSLRAEHIPEIIQQFLTFIDPHFSVFYAKISHFKNILSKVPLTICQDSKEPCYIAKDTKTIQTIDIINILSDLLLYYITIQCKGNPSPIGPWTSLGLEYFDTEYYQKRPTKVLGYPILQQKKLWNKDGIDLIKQSKASNGYMEWFYEFRDTVKDLSTISSDPYLQKKILEWIDILNYYNTVVNSQ